MKRTTNQPKSKLFIILMALLLALTPVLLQGQTAQAEAIPCLVTSNVDSGEGTLRAWLADTTCSTITFGDSYDIHLTSPLVIDTGRTVTIDGAGQSVTITDDTYWRVFSVDPGANATLQNLTITQSTNEPPAETQWMYGGLIRNSGTLAVNNSFLNGNPSLGLQPGQGMEGGGIYNAGILTVTRSTFTDNSATGGGAIYNDAYQITTPVIATVTDSTFTGNTSLAAGQSQYFSGLGGGGAIANAFGQVAVTGSTFTNNTANYAGGAIASAGNMTVTNSTLSGNTAASYGGAIFAYEGTLTNNTFVGNSAADGAISFYDVGMPLTLYNNLMVKGSMGTNCSIQIGSGTPGGITAANNLANDDSCSTAGVTTVSDLSMQVGTLGDNGGSTQTIPLLAGSAAINAGDDTVCPATDQRGVARPQGAHCDVGAYEYEPPSDYVVSGTVYEDLNANGARDADDPAAPGATVTLAVSSDQVNFYPWYSTDAAADGSYEFTFPTTHPEGLSFSVYVELGAGAKVTQTPAPFVYPTANLTGMDIGLHQIVLTVNPARFPDGVQGVFYNQTITVTGGDAPYTFTPATSWSVPAGLSYAFDTQAGTITLSGTPTEAGTFHTHVDFKEASGTFGQIWEDFTIYPPMQFSPESLPDGSLNAPYSQTILLSGGIAPYTFQNGSEQWLPVGLTLDTSSGNIVISGTPTEAGQVTLDVYVTDQTGNYIEIQLMFWIKTDPSLTLTSSLNPSLDGQEVTFSLGSTATVAHWPAPWGQVTFYADGAVISGCDGLWMGSDPTTEQPAPNPVTCKTSALAVGSHAISAALTTVYGPYNNKTAILPGGQTVNVDVPQYTSAGLSAPLDLGGVINSAKAGQMIPLKWRLLDSSGNPVTNLDPASVTLTVSAYACQAGTPTDAIETYVTGTTSLQNQGDGYYQLNWKTDKGYANQCKQITLSIDTWTGDGLTALFQFKK